MALESSDREDLLRAATALVERAELTVSGFGEPIVAGFRRDGAASFFFGADPVFQFNPAGELRRAYSGGRLLKAEGGRLVALQRERSAHETALVRQGLTEEETAAILGHMRALLDHLQEALARGEFQVVGESPPRGNVTARIAAWLGARPAAIHIAARPNAGG